MGGVETHCEELYPRLKRLRPTDDIVVFGRKPYMSGCETNFRGVRVIPLFALRNKHLEAISNTLIGILQARFVIKADVIHIHAIGPALLAPLAKILGMKVIVTHHGDDYRRTKWNALARIVLRLGEYLGVTYADAVILVSRSVTRRLKRKYPDRARCVQYIPNGANHLSSEDVGDRAGDASDIVRKLGLRGSRYALCVGRLVPEKCFEDAIVSFEKVEQLDQLVIVGGGDPNDSYVKWLFTLGTERVLFTGALSRRDVETLLAHASLFILPSSHEGLPIAVLEAISAGTPIIISDIEPNRDLPLPPHHYFRLHDIIALATMMQKDLRAYRVAQERLTVYDWTAISSETSAIYGRFAV
jgi:glycosyltransferase involved in cell wall biosynthesis